jgi:FkbM family methyltransferase
MKLPAKTTDLVQRLGAAAGMHITRIDNTLPHKRQRFLADLGIDVVLDIGANEGHWVDEVRRHGWAGPVVSFEPIAAVHAKLQARCGGDAAWRGLHMALGDSDGTSEINVSHNLVSSSLLAVTAASVDAAGATAIERRETITVRRLDGLHEGVLAGRARAYVKIDVQGFERQVLEGARGVLSQLRAIELELSLVELYAGQTLLPQMMAFAATLGFKPVWLERGFKDPNTGHLLQMDGIFVRDTG